MARKFVGAASSFVVALIASVTLSAQLPQTNDDLMAWLSARIKPLAPAAVSPLPGQVNVALSVSDDLTALTYRALGATRCDVFLGTDSNPPRVAQDIACGSWTGALKRDTKYYWKITAKNGAGSMTGPTWSFTTVPPTPEQPILNLTAIVIDVTNQPIPGATLTPICALVTCEDLPPASRTPRTVDGGGFVHFPVYGSLHVRVEADGYVAKEYDLPPDQPNTPPPGHRLTLERKAPEFPRRAGVVRLCNRAFCDDHGEWNALGFTYMHGASTVEVDPDGFDADMTAMARAGATYARMICFLDGGRIEPDPWANAGNADPKRCIRAIDRAWDRFGIRTEVTMFGGLRQWSSASARRAAVEQLLALLQPRLDRVFAVEVTNEAWMNWTGQFGATREEARGLAALVRQRLGSAVPIAISALAGVAEDQGVSADDYFGEAREVYAGSAANIWTPHFSRRTNTVDGLWRVYRQPWDNSITDPSGLALTPAASINNEPIGPESSGAWDGDPDRQVVGMVLSFAAGGGAINFHTDAGVWSNRLLAQYQTPHRGVFQRLTDHPTAAQILKGFAGALHALPAGLANWSRSRHLQAEHPFAPSFALVNGLTSQIWPDGITSYGVVRAYAATKGNDFIVTLLGIKDHFDIRCARLESFTVIRPGTWSVVAERTCDPGQTITIRQSDTPEAVVIGRYR